MRKCAREPRATVIDAAHAVRHVRHGCHICRGDRAAGGCLSAPYVHRLFGAKSVLVTAVVAEHTERLLGVLRPAASAREPDETALQSMAAAYAGMHDDDLGALRRQLHVWGAAHDPAVTSSVQSSFAAWWDEAERVSAGMSDEVRPFMAQAVLLTILASLDLMDLNEPNPPSTRRSMKEGS